MIYSLLYRRFAILIILIISVILGGTVGYHLIEKWSFVESFYMIVITISTVGFAEVAPLSRFGRIFKETNISKDIGIIIVALKSAVLNKLNFNPSSDTKINPGDVLISFGTPGQIGQLRKVCRASMKII